MLRRCRQAAPTSVRHVRNSKKFGLPVVVVINRFTADTPAELAEVVGRLHR